MPTKENLFFIANIKSYQNSFLNMKIRLDTAATSGGVPDSGPDMAEHCAQL